MFGLIMAGGLGTRLHTLYPGVPKLIAPVAGRPFLEWQLDWMIKGGVTRIHIAGGHLGGLISSYIATHKRAGIKTTFSQEPKPLGTAGALKFAEKYVESDPFFIINGDTLLPSLDFRTMTQPKDDALLTIAVTRIENAGRYGTVLMDDTETITAFLEKSVNTAGWVNGGVALVRKKLLAEIEAGKNISLESGILPGLAKRGLVRAFKTNQPLLDMGTPEGIKNMEDYLQEREK